MDNFPLPHIIQLINATLGHVLFTFVDAYFGYNQIPMYELDQECISYITDRGLYCFKVMLFGLKNERATYQRIVNTMFAEQIRKTMLVKSKKDNDHVADLRTTFEVLHLYQMKLNMLNYAFRVGSRKFLRYMFN